jgi:glycosyltransferase involved in cell wall biosynthesis
MEPLVTVILPTHNHAPFIAQAIESVLMQQTEFPFDILLHDDASTDGTADIVKEYAVRFPAKIRLITQKVNRYQIDKKIQTHILFPQITAKYTAICKTDVRGRVIGAAAPYETDRVVDLNDMIRAGGEFCSSNTIVAPTALLNAQPAFCELTEVEDVPVHMWCAVKGYAYYFAKHMAAYRYAVPGSWSARQKAASQTAQILHNEGVIGLLQGFDAYTEGRYRASYEYAIRHMEFKILCLRHDLKAAKRPPYRAFYQNLSVKRKLRLRLEKHFPKLAGRLLGWYGKMRNR